MIDIENYKRAIAWLRRGLIELQQEPDNVTVQIGIVHRFEVTHNVTEAILREAYFDLGVDEQAPYISIRAQISRAREEGLVLPTPTQWLKYALILESTKETWLNTAAMNLDTILPILPSFAAELDAFAQSLQRKMASLA